MNRICFLLCVNVMCASLWSCNNTPQQEKTIANNSNTVAAEDTLSIAAPTITDSGSVEIGEFNCVPKKYAPKILSAPNADSLHPDFKTTQVGLGWSFLSKKKITNSSGSYLAGDLYGSRGTIVNKSTCYVIFDEWSCSGE